MSQPLKHKLALLRRRERRLAAIRHLGAAASVALAVVVFLGLADYAIRFQDRGVRIVVSLVALSAAAGALCRSLYQYWKTRPTDLGLASRVEDAFPPLKNNLLSAIEFLQQSDDDPTAGSPALRQAVVAQATADSQPIDFCQVLDATSASRTATILTALGLLAALLFALAPGAATTALVRLANPLNQVAWPQHNHLAIRVPVRRVARGQAFDIEVIDAQGTRLPSDMHIHYRMKGPDGNMNEQVEALPFTAQSATVHRENVVRPFSYRVEGGDDFSMPWCDVHVVDPPTLESLSIRLTPPDYAGGREERSERSIRALIGTRISMSGVASRPLTSATLCLEGGKRVPAQIGENGTAFSIPATGENAVLVERSCRYWLELTDCDGVPGIGDHWEITALPDAPPTVAIEKPEGNVFATADTDIPLRVTAADDLAVRSIYLVIHREKAASDKSADDKPTKDETLQLYTGPEKPQPASASPSSPSQLNRHLVEHRWSLATLALQPGDQLTFWATATDYASQTAKSEPRRLTVISAQELEDRLTNRQRLLSAELERALKMERTCLAQVELLATHLGPNQATPPATPSGNRIEQADIDRLQASQLAQRETNQLLTSPDEGVPMHIRGLLTELTNSNLDQSDVERRMRGLLDLLEKMDRQMLTPIARDLTAATKTAQIELQDRLEGRRDVQTPTLAPTLAEIANRQGEVVTLLEQMLGRLGQWDNYHRFHRELTQLRQDQEEVGQTTTETGRRTLTQEIKDLPSSDAAALKDIAGRQIELARRLDRLFQDIERIADAVHSSDPTASQNLAAVMGERGKSDIDGQMRAAGSAIEQNQIGRAVALQRRIANTLKEMCESLANQGERPVQRADGAVKTLHDRQKAIIDETKRLQSIEQSQTGLGRGDLVAIRDLARQQRSLQTDTSQLGQQLAGDSAYQAAVAAAAQQMTQAAALLERRNIGNDAEQAEQQALEQLGVLLEVLQSAKTESMTQATGQPPTAEALKPGQPDQAGQGKPSEKPSARPGKSSGPPSGAQTAATGEEPSRRRLSPSDLRGAMKQLWGELPQHAREQMLQAPIEDFPTKYEQSIEDYFRRLAEEKRKE